MTIGVSIVHFVIKVPKLVQMIDIKYRLIKYPLSILDGLQKYKMPSTIFRFVDISTSDRGDFPRIIEIAL